MAGSTICACATAAGGRSALLRISGPATRGVLAACALPAPAPWSWRAASWPLETGPCPCRVGFAPVGRSYTGLDLAEIVLPGNPDLIAAALAALRRAGAEAAPPGAFTRQALAAGRISLDQAEDIHRLCTAPDADGAGRALAALRAGLADELAAVSEDILRLRGLVEAGLDFAEEPDVVPVSPGAVAEAAGTLTARLRRWYRASGSPARAPTVCLVGPANAGKSTLFRVLSGAPALVAPTAGTTRDWLEADLSVSGRVLRLIDTPGLTAEASEPASAPLAGAGLVLACTAPDAPLPPDWAPEDRDRTLVVGTKADLPAPYDPRCHLAVSARTGAGLDLLRARIGDSTADRSDAVPRQRELLAAALGHLDGLVARPRNDECAAEDLRLAAAALSDLIGRTTPEEVLDRIFARFCVGK